MASHAVLALAPTGTGAPCSASHRSRNAGPQHSQLQQRFSSIASVGAGARVLASSRTRRNAPRRAAAAAAAPGSRAVASGDDADVVVIGSGVGGLTAAALLAYYGKKVVVLESHYATGGAAHGRAWLILPATASARMFNHRSMT